MENYPTIAFLLRWGELAAALIAACVPVATLVLVAQGWPLLVLAAGLVAGVVTWGLLRSYVEVLRVVSDTLIPK